MLAGMSSSPFRINWSGLLVKCGAVLRPLRVAGVLSLCAWAASPPTTPQIWSLAELKQIDAQMTAAPRNHGLAVRTISVNGGDPGAAVPGKTAPNSLLLADRIATGDSEVHTTQMDIGNIIEGSATLVTGGTLTGERKVSDTEMRGESLTGTDRRVVKAGDVFVIPAGMPHQLVLGPGERLIYTVFKAEAQ